MSSNKVARAKSIAGPNVDDCLQGRERVEHCRGEHEH